ncbi:MAG: hypothetical protein B0W54_07330 [Cellvibrio sp. 79]|nr:MAG: hypothetical protein B0W54_07330 [Cellvibrio sp. 79]
MNRFVRNLGVTLFSLISATTYAKTFKYDLNALSSFQGPIHYPNLNFNQAKSAIFTVNKDPLSPEFQISSLEVSFPEAAKLVATGFKKIEPNLYRAVVNDIWVYRQVIVDVKDVDFNRPQFNSPQIAVYISEKSAFIQPETNTDFRGEPLFNVHGMIRDVTPAKIADTAVTTVSGKKLTLSLKDLLTYIAPGPYNGGDFPQGPGEGFVIDALWQGKGQKTIFIPAPVPVEEFDRYTAVALTLTERPSPFGTEYFFSIKYKEEGSTSEFNTPEQPLKPLLDNLYGVTP